MLWTEMYGFLKSFFIYEGVGWEKALITVGLAVAFGAIWLCGHWIPLLRKPLLLAVMAASAILTLLAVVFLQFPAQYYISQGLTHFWSNETLSTWLLLVGLPSVIVTGLVQEGAKMLPMVFWWRRRGMNISPKMGLAIGAAAGAGFGIFEAAWGMGNAFAGGWITDYISQYGFLGIAPFWERFFILGFHIAVSALVGYGLAKSKGWKYFLIGAGLHTLLNYSTIIYQYFTYVRGATFITVTRLEVFLAVFAVVITAWALILRWSKTQNEPVLPIEAPGEPITPIEPAESTPGPIVSVDMRTPPGA